MRVLLTGASGFIGRHVLSTLAAQNIDVVAVGRQRPAGLYGRFLEADLLAAGEAATVAQEAAASHLLHLAWYAQHGKYWNASVNLDWVEATDALVRAFCAQGGRRAVVAGSCAEYDWQASGSDLDEDSTPLQPGSLYGRSKLQARARAEAACRVHGAELVWARIFYLTGAGEPAARLVPSVVRVLKGELAPFSVDTNAQRDMLAVTDVAVALAHLLQAGPAGDVNIASGEGTRIGDIVQWIAEALGRDPSLLLDLAAPRPGEPRRLVGRNSRLLASGWRATTDLRSHLAARWQQ